MHGLGNDFVVVADAFLNGQAITPAIARAMGDRHFGIGFDQLLWLRAPRGADADLRMDIFNTDGSLAEMCGNGIRAVALYAQDRAASLGLPLRDRYVIETLGGLKTVEITGGGRSVVVDMGVPLLEGGFSGEAPGESLEVAGRSFRFYEVGMGNPHAVIFLPEGEDVTRFPFTELGPLIETLPRFPKRTNVEFVQVIDPRTIRVRVWERGAGPTLACGTGACGAAVAAIRTKKVRDSQVSVELPGGNLRITWEGGGLPVRMEGPAVEVFSGQYSIGD
jgi:diaminopimelate epimerase